MNTKDNARSRRTDEDIIRAFYALLDKKKSVSKISVREICELADINRSTFYAHYIDVYDLLEKVESTMEQRMTDAFLSQLYVPDPDIGKCFIAMFEFICEYREFFSIYLSEAAHPTLGLARELYKLQVLRVDYRELGYSSEDEMSFHEDFFLAGLTALVRRWLAGGCKESPQQLKEILGHQYSPNRELFNWK